MVVYVKIGYYPEGSTKIQGTIWVQFENEAHHEAVEFDQYADIDHLLPENWEVTDEGCLEAQVFSQHRPAGEVIVCPNESGHVW